MRVIAMRSARGPTSKPATLPSAAVRSGAEMHNPPHSRCLLPDSCARGTTRSRHVKGLKLMDNSHFDVTVL